MDFCSIYYCLLDYYCRYHHTAAIQLVYGMRAALAMVAREGLDNTINRHAVNAKTFTDGLARLGLELFVPDSVSFLHSLT